MTDELPNPNSQLPKRPTSAATVSLGVGRWELGVVSEPIAESQRERPIRVSSSRSRRAVVIEIDLRGGDESPYEPQPHPVLHLHEQVVLPGDAKETIVLMEERDAIPSQQHIELRG